TQRYLSYGVASEEGFNLRMDVYIRIANLVKLLRHHHRQDWTLVLPPWEHLYHWNTSRKQDQIPWAMFFDVPSLYLYTPVVEL
ncbi:predicted protein, partial [Nematostella vectensis]